MRGFFYAPYLLLDDLTVRQTDHAPAAIHRIVATEGILGSFFLVHFHSPARLVGLPAITILHLRQPLEDGLLRIVVRRVLLDAEIGDADVQVLHRHMSNRR